MAIRIDAYLDTVDPIGGATQHLTDGERVKSIIAHVIANGGRWNLPPVLVVEDDGNGALYLDGHHRRAAARELIENCYDYPGESEPTFRDLPAWVVSREDYDRIIETEFGGFEPHRIADIRDYIQCGKVDGNSVCEHGPCVD